MGSLTVIHKLKRSSLINKQHAGNLKQLNNKSTQVITACIVHVWISYSNSYLKIKSTPIRNGYTLNVRFFEVL